MTVPKIQEFTYSSWFREVWRPTPMKSEGIRAFKPEANKFKGEEKVRHIIRRNRNLDRAVGKGWRHSLQGTVQEQLWVWRESAALEMRPPWESLATLLWPWATRQHPKRSTNEQGMLHIHLWPCFNAYIYMSFMLLLLLEVPYALHANDKTEHSYSLEKEQSQGLRQVNFTSCPTYSEFCKAAWICYWSRLLAHFPRKFAATTRKSTKLDLLLLSAPEEADRTLCFA